MPNEHSLEKNRDGDHLPLRQRAIGVKIDQDFSTSALVISGARRLFSVDDYLCTIEFW